MHENSVYIRQDGFGLDGVAPCYISFTSPVIAYSSTICVASNEIKQNVLGKALVVSHVEYWELSL